MKTGGSEQQLSTIHPFSASNANALQCPHTSHGTPINEISVSSDTFSPAHPITCFYH
jgi:hypothetical protein